MDRSVVGFDRCEGLCVGPEAGFAFFDLWSQSGVVIIPIGTAPADRRRVVTKSSE